VPYFLLFSEYITGDTPMMGGAKWALCSLCDNKILPSVSTTNVGQLLRMAANNRRALGWFFNTYNHGSQNLKKSLSNEPFIKLLLIS
jgi:hypothetical protein